MAKMVGACRCWIVATTMSAALAGCGVGGDASPAGAGGATDGGALPDLLLPPPPRPPSDHPPVIPMQSAGGPVVASPEVYTVVWKGDEAVGAQIAAFVSSMLADRTYWAGTLSQYGVGPGVAAGTIALGDAPPATIDDAALDALVDDVIVPRLAQPPTGNTMISFLVPATTRSTAGADRGCVDYGGYHNESHVLHVAYAVNLRCPGQALTEVVSHELAEAATDPRPFSAPGWYHPVGGEVGDLCPSMQVVLAGATTREVVNRLWSNAAAATGNSDPCRPAPADRPWADIAVDPSAITIASDQSGLGQVTVRLEPFAFGDVGLFSWSLVDLPAGVTASPASGTSRAGDTVPVTLTATAQATHAPASFGIDIQEAQGATLRGNWPVLLIVE